MNLFQVDTCPCSLKKKLCPYVGTIPPTKKFLLICSPCGWNTDGMHSGKLCFHKNYGLIEPTGWSWSNTIPESPFFGQIFGHHVLRATIDGRNTNMNRGQETHPIRLNARYPINLIFWKKIPETSLARKYLANRWPKLRVGTWKSIEVKRLVPIRVNARYQMSWANSFSLIRDSHLGKYLATRGPKNEGRITIVSETQKTQVTHLSMKSSFPKSEIDVEYAMRSVLCHPQVRDRGCHNGHWDHIAQFIEG